MVLILLLEKDLGRGYISNSEYSCDIVNVGCEQSEIRPHDTLCLPVGGALAP